MVVMDGAGNAQLRGKCWKVIIRGAAKRELDMAGRAGAINGETGGIRSTIAKNRQHTGGEAPKFWLQRPVFQKKSRYATHGSTYLV